MKIIVLSMDTEIGKIRREKLNYDYELFNSVSGEEIMDKFNFMGKFEVSLIVFYFCVLKNFFLKVVISVHFE